MLSSKLSLLSRLLTLMGLMLLCTNCTAPFSSESAASTAPPATALTATDSTASIEGAKTSNTNPLAWSQWPVVLSEPFHDNRRRWLVGKYDGTFSTAKLAVGPDVYRFDIQAKKGLVYTSTTAVFPVTMQEGFYLAVDAKKIQGPDDASYGLVFLDKQRPDKEHDHYYFELRDQDFRFAVHSKGEWRTVIDWTRSPRIQPNKVNRLAVFAQGTRFTFYMNDTSVDEIEDEELKDGRIGVGVELFHSGDVGIYEFDNLEVRTP